MAKITKLDELLKNNKAGESHIVDQVLSRTSNDIYKEAVPFPKLIQVETTNICNHGCEFCAYTTMERKKKHINRELFLKIVKDSYELGSRQIGLFSGAEPLTCKWLDQYIKICKDIGYEYCYISTNGSLANLDKFIKLVEAGLDSIKFSVNGGNREIYKKIHAKDDFDKVIENIIGLDNYRKKNKKKIWLGVSFVATPESKESFYSLEKILGKHVDEIIMYEANNQSGQVDHLEPGFEKCSLPFAKAHFTVEGYLRACCNDYENLLALEDINKVSIKEAWNGERFKSLRKKHIENKLDGTLCGKCIRNSKCKVEPLNSDLV
jgi:MoaA/NifB/PqqE/SkfB family radical SAM enzyme